MSTAFRTQRWVGIQPVRAALGEREIREPRAFVAKVYESLHLVLDSLWAHHLRFESNEVTSLLLMDHGDTLANLLEQRSDFHFTAHELLDDVKRFVAQKQSKTYPGHGVVCLFLLARAKSNEEIQAASDLCESIAQSLQIVASHLNRPEISLTTQAEVISQLVRRWKKTFPYSE